MSFTKFAKIVTEKKIKFAYVSEVMGLLFSFNLVNQLWKSSYAVINGISKDHHLLLGTCKDDETIAVIISLQQLAFQEEHKIDKLIEIEWVGLCIKKWIGLAQGASPSQSKKKGR